VQKKLAFAALILSKQVKSSI